MCKRVKEEKFLRKIIIVSRETQEEKSTSYHTRKTRKGNSIDNNWHNDERKLNKLLKSN